LTKAVDDLAGRLQGAAAGLIGFKDRASGPDKDPNAPPPPVPPTPEDVAKFRQMIEEIKGIAEAMEKEFDKEHPKSDGGSGSAGGPPPVKAKGG
jgi:hypothetical protein